MPITDNRTQLQDGQNNNEVSGDTDAAPTSASTVSGTFIESTGSIAFQVDDAQEAIWFDQDTGGATFNLDLSDSTVYIYVKFGTPETFANLGGLICLKDGADGAGGDGIGYAVAGADVSGFPYEFGFAGMKLDVSVVVASPGTNNVDYFQYFGTEAGLAQTAVLQVGFGSFSLVKAVSTSPNAWFDGIYYIANGSYAATIDGGTAGTPETMTDIAGDDVTSGMGLINNPKGSEYGFFGPTQWGTPSGTASSYFTANNEQWYLYGDNAGGHAVGATHFPFRLIGNGTGTNLFQATNVVIVNTGTAAEFDASDTNMDTVEFDGCTLIGLASFDAPSSGGTSRLCTNTAFINCGLVTSNLADMSGNSYVTPTVAADGAALSYDEALASPKSLTTLDNSSFEQGTNAHHAISFGTGIDENITLTGLTLDGFSNTDNANGSTFEFLATTGSINLTLVDCTVDGVAASASNVGVDSAGITVTIITGAVDVDVTTQTGEGVAIASVRVHLRASDGTGPLPYQDAVTISRTTTTATVTHTAHGLNSNDKIYLRGIDDKTEDNGVQQVTVTDANTYTFTTTDSGSTSYTARNWVIDAQDETSYDDTPTSEGTFAGGSGHAVSDVITLDRQIRVTVDAVSSGVVTEFTVDATDGGAGLTASDTLNQRETTGSGTGFSLTVDTDNLVAEIRSTYVALDGDTNGSGLISTNRVFSGNQPVEGWARKSTSAPYYQQGPITGTISSATGLNVTAVMVSDE